jgi:hypothetical protein
MEAHEEFRRALIVPGDSLILAAAALFPRNLTTADVTKITESTFS